VLPKWVPSLLILFVIFFILSNPQEAGPQARSFFGWIGAQASSAGTFLDGLFGDDETNPNGTNPALPSTEPGTSGGGVTNGAGSSQDSFNTIGPIVIESVY
jgi:hypothetical protein